MTAASWPRAPEGSRQAEGMSLNRIAEDGQHTAGILEKQQRVMTMSLVGDARMAV
jgi:hypothetical protein